MDVTEDFDGSDLDRDVWLPHYLPAWSSLSATRASYEVRDGALRLFIPPDQGLWCPDDHRPPLRVSGIQSGNFSGPVGSTVGQQPFRAGQTVREAQEPFWGWTPGPSAIEIRARGTVTPRSMVAFWMVGLEDRPERSAEICVMEIFGRSVDAAPSAEVGTGVHRFRDPDAVEDWQAVRVPIDVADFHRYGVDWTSDRVDYLVDGTVIRSTPSPPAYPMQLMLAVFDFPEWSVGNDADAVPELVVDYVRAGPSASA